MAGLKRYRGKEYVSNKRRTVGRFGILAAREAISFFQNVLLLHHTCTYGKYATAL
jgi:hypothetical protein